LINVNSDWLYRRNRAGGRSPITKSLRLCALCVLRVKNKETLNFKISCFATNNWQEL